FRSEASRSWTTWRRLPLIDEAVANFLGPFLRTEAKRHGARVMEVGIVRDHVHLLLALPPVYDAPRLVQGLKGASARIANRDGHSGRGASAGRRATISDRSVSGSFPASRLTFAIKS